ncbi:hypothetical protein EUA06_03490 [Nocardioides glacieisoli]|uniref:Uncharacterized protein n=1 Tax=Nocardioides glacieisoli TaxID=1168730 RepID=A0A4Q2S5L9_9ACTN|nr:hypothetical protein [Nocardioides glacieisoli]RYB96636.1 hypothetical protein EUA06_03490 [Nocardioides glacieisoli]
MSSVDDRLREAFATPDDEWVRRAPVAHRELRARHRRHQLVRLGVVSGLAAAAVVVAVAVVGGDPGTRTIEPADPTPTSTAPAGAAPLEGTWISGPLGRPEVRAAARAAGAPDAAGAMLEDLPDGTFRVVMVVRGSSLQTRIRSTGAEDAIMDEEIISTSGAELRLRTLFGDPGASVHGWRVRGDELTMTFRSTTEGASAGVPGEAWHRLLYDSAPFTR